MLKYLLAYIVCIVSVISNAQTDFGLKLGGNIPIYLDQKYPPSNLGLDLGFSFHYHLKDKLGLEYGLLADMDGQLNAANPEYSNTAYLRFSFYLPLQLTYHFHNDKFIVKSGLFGAYRNCLTFTNFSGMDPENPGMDPTYLYPMAKNIGVDYNVEAGYYFIDNMLIYASCRVPILALEPYVTLSLGLQYVFNFKE